MKSVKYKVWPSAYMHVRPIGEPAREISAVNVRCPSKLAGANDVGSLIHITGDKTKTEAYQKKDEQQNLVQMKKQKLNSIW